MYHMIFVYLESVLQNYTFNPFGPTGNNIDPMKVAHAP